MTEQFGDINATLSQCSLFVKGADLSRGRPGWIYLRGRAFPPKKPGDSRGKQYEISTGWKNTPQNQKLAKAFAQRVDGELMLGAFSWSNYSKDRGEAALTVADWVKKLEANYWARTPRSAKTENTWRKSYRQYYDHLPLESQLSEDLLTKALLKYPAASRSRQLCSVAFAMLASCAQIEAKQIKALGQGYKPPKKTLEEMPTDEAIADLIDGCRDRATQWIAGMAAAFGLRNHEILGAEISRIREGIISVAEDAKTGAREVYAIPFEWVERWVLWDKPQISIKLDCGNNKIGSAISQRLKYYGLPRCYTLRDAYGIRVDLLNLGHAFGPRWMGHSVQIHHRHYLSAIQAYHDLIVYQKAKKADP